MGVKDYIGALCLPLFAIGTVLNSCDSYAQQSTNVENKVMYTDVLEFSIYRDPRLEGGRLARSAQRSIDRTVTYSFGDLSLQFDGPSKFNSMGKGLGRSSLKGTFTGYVRGLQITGRIEDVVNGVAADTEDFINYNFGKFEDWLKEHKLLTFGLAEKIKLPKLRFPNFRFAEERSIFYTEASAKIDGFNLRNKINFRMHPSWEFGLTYDADYEIIGFEFFPEKAVVRSRHKITPSVNFVVGADTKEKWADYSIFAGFGRDIRKRSGKEPWGEVNLIVSEGSVGFDNGKSKNGWGVKGEWRHHF